MKFYKYGSCGGKFQKYGGEGGSREEVNFRNTGREEASYIKTKYPAVTLPGQVRSPKPTARDGKTCEHANNAGVNKFLALVAKPSFVTI